MTSVILITQANGIKTSWESEQKASTRLVTIHWNIIIYCAETSYKKKS